MVQHHPQEGEIALSFDERRLALGGFMGSAALAPGRELFLKLHRNFTATLSREHPLDTAQQDVPMPVPDSRAMATSLKQAFEAYRKDRCAKVLEHDPPFDPTSLTFQKADIKDKLADSAIQDMEKIIATLPPEA